MSDTKISVETWAPILGLWTYQSRVARYEGRSPESVSGVANPIGISICSEDFSEGEIEADFRLPPDDPMELRAQPSAYFLLGYRSPFDEYILVGLAGFESAYTVSRFVPSRGWIPL